MEALWNVGFLFKPQCSENSLPGREGSKPSDQSVSSCVERHKKAGTNTTFARMVPLSAKPSAAKKFNSENTSRDEEGYHVIGCSTNGFGPNNLYFGLLSARSSCVWYHVSYPRSRDGVKVSNTAPEAIIFVIS